MVRRARFLIAMAAALAILAAASASPAAAQSDLRAGVGRADITPPQTGYFLGGWTRADRVARGQHTRLYAKAMVLQQGDRKVALVAAELFAMFAGLQQHVAERLTDRGFREGNVLISVTHTHSGPGGYANFSTLNTAAPSINTITDPSSFAEFINPKPTDRQLYTFLVERIATAIERADRDLDPAVAGWGSERLTGITRNRSLEAHLADHGIIKDLGKGRPDDDPDGAIHTIDPAVDVLRIDKVRGRRRIPIGAWSSFANHGTVTKAEFEAYDGDHHASAHRVFEARVRQAGGVRRRQDVVNVYGNGNEGDQSAGLDFTGPAGADEVGRAEAAAMFRAWKTAGRRLSRRAALDLRWTRVCFCGQATEGGNVSSRPVPGLPFLTGSEENRGPLFDITGVPFEDRRSPVDGFDSQGHKIGIPAGDYPQAVPIMVVRVGSRLIASLPGEPTKEVGARVSSALLDAKGSMGVRRVVVAGLANEFIQYITTPEEYDRQHYEGGSTIFGRLEMNFLRDGLVGLTKRMAAGEPEEAPYEFDPTNGVRPDGIPYPAGAESGEVTAQPISQVGRLGHPRIRWQGSPLGRDRPVDRAFIRVERRDGRRWREVDSDLGLAILWRVDAQGRYSAYWEVPINTPAARYRMVVTASRYRLESQSFRVVPARLLTVREAPAPEGRVAVTLGYPTPRENVDLTARPPRAVGGSVTFTVGDRRITVRRSRGTTFSVAAPAGTTVRVDAGDARDASGNLSGAPFRVR